jgi:hypothetical protein
MGTRHANKKNGPIKCHHGDNDSPGLPRSLRRLYGTQVPQASPNKRHQEVTTVPLLSGLIQRLEFTQALTWQLDEQKQFCLVYLQLIKLVCIVTSADREVSFQSTVQLIPASAHILKQGQGSCSFAWMQLSNLINDRPHGCSDFLGTMFG